MTKYYISAVLAVLMASLTVSAGLAADPQVFRNSDLDRYSKGGGTRVSEPESQAADSRQRTREGGNAGAESAKYWCDTATEVNTRVKNAETDLSSAKARKDETWRGMTRGNRADAVEADNIALRNLEAAEAELAAAKQEKENLESEAHQKNIPPGWLRCQPD